MLVRNIFKVDDRKEPPKVHHGTERGLSKPDTHRRAMGKKVFLLFTQFSGLTASAARNLTGACLVSTLGLQACTTKPGSGTTVLLEGMLK
jgi:hypothetical protein